MALVGRTKVTTFEYPVDWEVAAVVAHYITATTMGAGIEIIREFDTIRFPVQARNEEEARNYATAVLNDIVVRPGYYIETIVCIPVQQ